ncbi:hypothetical protein FIBSPDRAFT_860634 [Athelia psychrophila]|uniref:Uncharacterized protein n=1 Tax=Athelia psychrophila TaxID=1759441 RepID=A0A166K2D1_9AGAM|nr:hypothetical protein FIBSPDRAFT_860634 [Fibularhizoctonia sp. CBS 109695]
MKPTVIVLRGERQASQRRISSNLSSTLSMQSVSSSSRPTTTQRYRAEILYEGPNGRQMRHRGQGLRSNGPLVLHVSKMKCTPKPSDDNGGRFYALGRVFVRSGPKVQKGRYVRQIYPAHHSPDGSSHRARSIEGCPAGSTIGLVGIYQFLLKSVPLTPRII